MAKATDRESRAAQPKSAVRRELGRGERVLPGVFRLRLPLPWPGVPHVNAWAIESGAENRIVLVDTGINEEDAFEELEHNNLLASPK